MSQENSNVGTDQKKKYGNHPFYSEDAFVQQLTDRHQRGTVGKWLFRLSNVVALIMLVSLFLHIINSAFGYVVISNQVNPAELANQPLEQLSEDGLADILERELGGRVLVLIRDELSQVPTDEYTSAPVSDVLDGLWYPQNQAESTIRDLEMATLGNILSRNLTQGELLNIVEREVVKPRVVESWYLSESLFNAEAIEAQAAEDYPDETDQLEFYSWLTWDFITDPPTSEPTTTGLKRALLGSVWVMVITSFTSLLLGVGAAIYLEEYANDNWLNRTIEINIRNLAAIPSVIYGMLGLTIFVYTLTPLTSGTAFGLAETENGRTVLSGGLTLALLILPIIIVNAQEAIRAVPNSFREASYGLGATKLQTVSKQVLPAALPGIMTGVILALSRAVGETAPLLVVGASTFLSSDPSGPFSKFTVVPIQIYQWTAQPSQQFNNVAAAAIIVLLAVMLMLNATAIIIRNRFSRKN